MVEPDAITAATTVREAVARYPGAETIFDQHGLTGCGGPNSPAEPIGFFAAVHHVDPKDLIRELNDFAASQATASADAPPAQDHAPAAGWQPYPLFLVTALAFTLAVGVTTGIAAAMTGGGWGALRGEGWIALVQAHGHTQVFGFVGLFIMGMAFHILPRFKGQSPPDRRLVMGSYALVTAGVLARVLAQPHGEGWLRWLFGASAVLELAGAALFAAIILSIFVRARARREAFDRYVMAAVTFLPAAAALNLYLVLRALNAGDHVLNPAGDTALLEGAVFGFVVLFVLGVSFRVMPFFLALQAPYARLRDAALVTIVVSVIVRAVALWMPQFGNYGWAEPTERIAAFALAAGIIAAIIALRVFESSSGEGGPGETPPAFAAMVRTAYVWLVAAVALDLYWQLREIDGGFTGTYSAGAIRHAVLLGFATLMLMAMAYRTIPVFSGRALRWPRAVPVSFGLVAGAAVLRVFPVAFTTVPDRLDFKLITAGGFLLFGGLSVFAAEICASMFNIGRPTAAAADAAVVPEHVRDVAPPAEPQASPETPAAADPAAVPARKRPPGPIARDTVVSDALALSPAVLQVLLDYGFGPLADPEMRARMAPTITIERAAAFLSANPDDLVDTLNIVVGQSKPKDEGGLAPIEVTMIETSLHKADLLDALKSVNDPEVPVNIVDLGLVYSMLVRESYVRVTMGLTSPDCPLADEVEGEVRVALGAVHGVEAVDVEIVLDPPWSWDRMSPTARAAMGW
jgi:metal-sulfur cluster biosynthetic enzyme